jgi:hypothetical protein
MNNIHKAKTIIALFVSGIALLLSATGAWATGLGNTTNHFVNVVDKSSPVTYIEKFATTYANNGPNDVCNIYLNGILIITRARHRGLTGARP